MQIYHASHSQMIIPILIKMNGICGSSLPSKTRLPTMIIRCFFEHIKSRSVYCSSRSIIERVRVMPISTCRASFLIITSILLSLNLASLAQQVGRQEDNNWPPGWTERCLGCICEAASNCNETIGCIEEYCGMFLVSRGYWVDAGSPVLIGDDPNITEAFTRCVSDPYCAARTVNQYIHKFIQDCNQDGSLSCDDYARLHYLGFSQCTRSLRSVPYYRQFQRCFRNNPNTGSN